ncbi:MAG: helix-turn-helix domain-containing protein [Acidimicrobiales bacterium]
MKASEAIEVLKRCRPDELVAVDLAYGEDVESPAQQQLTGDWQRRGESFIKDDMAIARDLSIRKLLLTVPEVGQILAISRSKVYELLESGSMPSVYIGRSRRIRVSDVEAFVTGGGREY